MQSSLRAEERGEKEKDSNVDPKPKYPKNVALICQYNSTTVTWRDPIKEPSSNKGYGEMLWPDCHRNAGYFVRLKKEQDSSLHA